MSNIEDLTDLLENDVIPEIEGFIDDLFEKIADNKHASSEDKEQLKEVQELRDEFKLMLQEVKSGEMDEDECAEIIEEIDTMRNEEGDGQ